MSKNEFMGKWRINKMLKSLDSFQMTAHSLSRTGFLRNAAE